MKTCMVEVCESPVDARGHCKKHYWRLVNKGSADWEPPTIEERFWTHVEKTDTCWNWTAAKTPGGYGKSWNGKGTYAHRQSLEMLGFDLTGKEVDHLCHNPSCVNPSHLRPADRKANVENFAGPRSDNTSGYRGVSWLGREGKWRAQVKHHGVIVFNKLYDDPREAGEAAAEARRKWHRSNYKDRV